MTNVTVCSLCGKEIRYKHTPTHLSQHLRTCHEKKTSNNEDKNDIKLEEKKKKEIVESFKSLPYFSCTNDTGSSLDGRSFVDVNVHWVSEECVTDKKILTVVEMIENKTAANYTKAVDEKLEEFGILDKTFSFTTDNENTMRKAFLAGERN